MHAQSLKQVLLILVDTLRPRQNGHCFTDNTFKRIFLNENVRISIKISLKFVPKGPINNNPALVQIMAWRQSGDKPLSEPMVVSLLTHICNTRPQLVQVCLHGTQQAAWLTHDILQCDLLCGGGIYMVGSGHTRLLHITCIIYVSAVSEVGVLQKKCSWQPVPLDNLSSKLNCSPGWQQSCICCEQACRHANTPVVFLRFYFVARHTRTACCVLCKCSFRKRGFSGPFIYIQTIWKTSLDCSFVKISTFVHGKTSFL